MTSEPIRKLGDLRMNKKNPRKISEDQLQALKSSLEKFGDLSGFVFNRRSQQIVGGHQRNKVLPAESEIEILESYDRPTSVGTVAVGRVRIGEELFSYREVDWDESTEKAANIAANKHGGEWDFSKLEEWLKDLHLDSFDLALTGFSAGEIKKLIPSLGGEELSDAEKEELYSKKIKSPIYEPKGERPKIVELYDLSKSKVLREEIEATDLDPEVKTFLGFAASRHIIFDYEKIAEYYAHASKPIQELMEKSALVIIDFDKAIENGFVTLTKEISDAYASSHEPATAEQ